jgi:hypothetical protein
VRLLVSAQDDDPHARHAPDDLAGRGDPVHAGHRDIHQDDVRLLGFDEVEAVSGRSRLADQLVRRHRREEIPNTRPENVVVVNQNDSQD